MGLALLAFALIADSSLSAPPPDPSITLSGAQQGRNPGLSVIRLGFRYEPLSKVDEISQPMAQVPGAVIMPKFEVKESREKLTEEAALTDKANLAIAEDKYISPFYRITFGPLMQVAAYFHDPLGILNGWHPNEAEAKTLSRQDKRLEQLNELDSLIGLEMIDDSKDATQFKSLRYDAATASR